MNGIFNLEKQKKKKDLMDSLPVSFVCGLLVGQVPWKEYRGASWSRDFGRGQGLSFFYESSKEKCTLYSCDFGQGKVLSLLYEGFGTLVQRIRKARLC